MLNPSRVWYSDTQQRILLEEWRMESEFNQQWYEDLRQCPLYYLEEFCIFLFANSPTCDSCEMCKPETDTLRDKWLRRNYASSGNWYYKLDLLPAKDEGINNGNRNGSSSGSRNYTRR